MRARTERAKGKVSVSGCVFGSYFVTQLARVSNGNKKCIEIRQKLRSHLGGMEVLRKLLETRVCIVPKLRKLGGEVMACLCS